MDRILKIKLFGINVYRQYYGSLTSREQILLVDENGIQRKITHMDLNLKNLMGYYDDAVYVLSDAQMRLADVLEFDYSYNSSCDTERLRADVKEARIETMSDDGVFVTSAAEAFDKDVYTIMSIVFFYYRTNSDKIVGDFDYDWGTGNFHVSGNTLKFKTLYGVVYTYKILDKNKFKNIIVKEVLMNNV